MLLVSDGVVEARTRQASSSASTAPCHLNPIRRTIAHAAQEFGQDDDITVLTLARA